MTTIADPPVSDMTEVFHEQPIDVDVHEGEVDPVPLAHDLQRQRVMRLIAVLPGLNLSEKREAWLRNEIIRACMPLAGDPVKVKFARMEMSDWSRWAKAELERRKRAGMQKINGDVRLQGEMRAVAMLNNERQRVTLQDRVDYHTLEAEGIAEMLDYSLEKGGMKDPAERKRTLAKIDPMRQANIAWSVASMSATPLASGDIEPIPSAETFGGGETNPTAPPS